MRTYTLSILQSLSKDKKPIGELEIIVWANEKLQSSKGYQLDAGFKDNKLKTAVPIIDLVDAIKPKSVDYELVYQDGDDDSNLQNAKLAISLARRIGGVVFALPEDIVELKAKMLLTIFASLMAVDLGVRA